MSHAEQRGKSAVAWLKGTKHRLYEDRYRLLPREVPLVGKANRGELFAVCDGIGSAPMGMCAAQTICDRLIDFYHLPSQNQPGWMGIQNLLISGNREIFDWGFIEGTNRPLGGCAGTIAWLYEENGSSQLTIFHAGDTMGLLLSGSDVRVLTTLHEHQGAIYRYFGLGEPLEIEVKTMEVDPGDQILLISDGVTKAFHHMDAANIVRRTRGGLTCAVRELVRLSRLKGSADDITALAVEVAEPEE